MSKYIKIAGAFLGMTGVMIGAFGAHALKEMLLEAGRFDTFETAVRYQFYHALLLLLIGFMMEKQATKSLKWAGICAIVGVVIFSGALYLICFTGITLFGAVAPIGGTLLVVAWAMLILNFLKEK